MSSSQPKTSNQPKTAKNPRGAGRPKTNKLAIYLTGIDDRTYQHLIDLRQQKRLNSSVLDWADKSAKIDININQTKPNKMTLPTPDAIFNELDRLEVSTNQDYYSGIMTTTVNVVAYSPEGDGLQVVKLYDDYAENIYDGVRLLTFLKGLKAGEVSLSSDSIDNIWQRIKSFEV